MSLRTAVWAAARDSDYDSNKGKSVVNTLENGSAKKGLEVFSRFLFPYRSARPPFPLTGKFIMCVVFPKRFVLGQAFSVVKILV